MNKHAKFHQVEVSAAGVRFGNAWYSHESITGYSSDQLNEGNCHITGQQYVKWLNSAPVPPAGDVEVLASLGLTLAVLNEAFNAQDSTERLANMDVPRVMRSAFKDFERVKTEATRLTAELTLERTRADVAVADCNDAEAAGRNVSLLLSERTAERDALQTKCEAIEFNLSKVDRIVLQQQSELTKARELQPLMDQVGSAYEFLTLCRNDTTDTAIDTGAMRDAFEWLSAAAENLGKALQSAPAVAHKTMREEQGISVEEWVEFMVWLKNKKPAPAARGSRETVDVNLREPSFYRNKDND